MYYLLIFFSFFPFITLYNLGTDIQPYALIISFIIFIKNKMIVYKKFLMLFNIFLYSFLLLIILRDFSFSSIRSFANYASLFFISSASYTMMKKNNGLKEFYIKMIFNIWFVIGFIQTYIKKDFLLFLVSGGRTSLTRGVPGLNSEPSFYAYMLIFGMLISLDFHKNKILYLINLGIQLIFFARSAIGVLYLFIYLILLSIKYISSFKVKNYIKIFLIFGIFLIIYIVILKFMEGTRINALMNMAINNHEVLYKDQSIESRFYHIYFSVIKTIENFFLPHGFSDFRIMSGLGLALYELGFGGVLLIYSIYKIINQSIYHKLNKLNSIFVIIILFSAIQLANPILSFYLGYTLYGQKNKPLKY